MPKEFLMANRLKDLKDKREVGYMRKKIKKGLFAGLGLASLGVLGKTIYDYYQEKSNQSKQSWFLERFFKWMTWPFITLNRKLFFTKALNSLIN